MNKKNTILTLTLAFCLVLAFAGNASAGPSQYYFDEWNCVYVEVSQLGMFNGNQWAVLGFVDLSGTTSEVGLGFSWYNPTYGDLTLHIVRDAGWWSHSWEGTWAGSGTEFVLAVADLYHGIHSLWTTPPAITSDSSANPAAGLVHASGVGNADAGPSQFYFDQWNCVYVEAAQLGMFNGNQCAILAKVDLGGVVPEIGLGFSFYHPTYYDLCLHITADPAWLSHSWEGTWAGSGTNFVVAVSDLYHDIHPLWTTPPAITTDSANPAAR